VNQNAKEVRLERRENLAFCFQELFTAIVRVRFNLQSVPSAEDFRANAKELIRMATHRAAALGYSGVEDAQGGGRFTREFEAGGVSRSGRTLTDVKLAAFAVVSFLDESILTAKSPIFANWPRMTLQEELFGEHLAGETFFQYVQELLTRRDSSETSDVLEIYYLCMLLGYRGRYGSSGEGELRAIMESIKGKIGRVRGNPPLSPAWALPGDPPLPKNHDPWLRRFAWTAALAALLALATFGAGAWTLAAGNSLIQSSADQLK
jgi:type VI secretion system protein ImpK